MNEFRTIKDVLVSDENNLIFSKLKKTTIEHQYWIIVISEILSKLPYQKTKGVSQSIVRVYESNSSFTLKKNKFNCCCSKSKNFSSTDFKFFGKTRL